MSSRTFTDLGVSKPVTDALAKRNIIKPFAVQNLVVEEILNGHDVLAQSPTGSGKTLAFGMPIVDLIKSEQRIAQPRWFSHRHESWPARSSMSLKISLARGH